MSGLDTTAYWEAYWGEHHKARAAALEDRNAVLEAEVKALKEALDYCCKMLEMLCPDTAGTPAAQHGREVLNGPS